MLCFLCHVQMWVSNEAWQENPDMIHTKFS